MSVSEQVNKFCLIITYSGFFRANQLIFTRRIVQLDVFFSFKNTRMSFKRRLVADFVWKRSGRWNDDMRRINPIANTERRGWASVTAVWRWRCVWLVSRGVIIVVRPGGHRGAMWGAWRCCSPYYTQIHSNILWGFSNPESQSFRYFISLLNHIRYFYRILSLCK